MNPRPTRTKDRNKAARQNLQETRMAVKEAVAVLEQTGYALTSLVILLLDGRHREAQRQVANNFGSVVQTLHGSTVVLAGLKQYLHTEATVPDFAGAVVKLRDVAMREQKSRSWPERVLRSAAGWCWGWMVRPFQWADDKLHARVLRRRKELPPPPPAVEQVPASTESEAREVAGCACEGEGCPACES